MRGGNLRPHRGKLDRTRSHEQVAHVEAERCGPCESDLFRERGIRIVEVDVGLGRQRDKSGTGRRDLICIPEAGEEADLVSAGDEVTSDLQQRHDVAVCRRAGDEVTGHDGFFP